MEDPEKWKDALRHFSRADLDSILKHRKKSVLGGNRDELIESMCQKASGLCQELSAAYEMLKGVSVNGVIQEIFLARNDLGPIVADCRKKTEIVTALILANELAIVERVADYARYTRKRQVSPLRFEGHVKQKIVKSQLAQAVKAVIKELNKNRPRVLVLEDASYSPSEEIVRIAVSREAGRRHVRQLPERAPSPEFAEHDDYPLRPHVIEVDLKRLRMRTTFGGHDQDGLQISQSVLEGFVELEGGLQESSFHSNVLDSKVTDQIEENVDEAKEEYAKDSALANTLEALQKAKRVSLSIRGLNVAGDLRRLDIQAGDVDKVLATLGVDPAILEGAKDSSFELELPDGRRIRVSRHKLTFVGEFSAGEQRALEEVFST